MSVTVFLNAYPMCSECGYAIPIERKGRTYIATHPPASEYQQCSNSGKRFEVSVFECREIPEQENKDAAEYLKDATAL